MKVKKITQKSTNRREFNHAYKMYLESKGKIRCSYCGYHHNENRTTKCYGGFIDEIKKIRYPNWKLVSKNKKQWMEKPIEKTEEEWKRGWYVEITW